MAVEEATIKFQVVTDKKELAELKKEFAALRSETGKFQAGEQRIIRTSRNLFSANRDTTEIINKQGQITKKTTKGFQRFNFEMLGTLFFGQALSQMFNNITGQMLDLFGATAILNAAFMIMTINSIQPLNDLIFDLSVGLIDLPEPIRDLFGALMIGVNVGGSVLAYTGQIALGFASLGIAAGALGISLGAILIPLGLIGAAVLLVVAIWQNWFGIRDIIIGVINRIAAPFQFLIGLLEGLGVLDFIGKLWDAVWNSMVAVVRYVWGILRPILEPLLNILKGIFDVVGGVVEFFFGSGEQTAFESGQSLGRALRGAPQLAEGGIVTRPTLAPVYATGTGVDLNEIYRFGERGPEAFVPLSGGGGGINFSPSVSIDAAISSDVDIDRLSERLMDRWKEDLSRMSFSNFI